MTSYRIGRSPEADIIVDDSSVSRKHADLIIARDGRYCLVDLQSMNGSFRRRGSRWVRLSRDYVAADEPIRLGSVETNVSDLLKAGGISAAHGSEEEPGQDPGSGEVERDEYGMVRPKR